MIRPLLPLASAVALAAATTSLAAQAETATAAVTYEIREISEINLSGDPAPLVVAGASAGSAPADAVDETTTWNVTTNETNRKITGVLDSDLPPGVTLRIALTPPDGGATAGSVPLSTASQDLITGLGSVRSTELGVTYTLSATPEAGVVPRGSRTVTFTIVTDA